MDISDVLKYISYKPKKIYKNDEDHMIAEFRRYKGFVPTLDFYCDRIIFAIEGGGAKFNELLGLNRVVLADVGEVRQNLIDSTRMIVRKLHNLYSGGMGK